jgi:hypothetical protein
VEDEDPAQSAQILATGFSLNQLVEMRETVNMYRNVV